MTEFTTKVKGRLLDLHLYYQSDEHSDVLAEKRPTKDLLEACKIIDEQAAEIKAKDREIGKMKAISKMIISITDRVQTKNTELLEMLMTFYKGETIAGESASQSLREVRAGNYDKPAKDEQIRQFRTILESALRVLDRGENIEPDSICHEEIEQALKEK